MCTCSNFYSTIVFYSIVAFRLFFLIFFICLWVFTVFYQHHVSHKKPTRKHTHFSPHRSRPACVRVAGATTPHMCSRRFYYYYFRNTTTTRTLLRNIRTLAHSGLSCAIKITTHHTDANNSLWNALAHFGGRQTCTHVKTRTTNHRTRNRTIERRRKCSENTKKHTPALAHLVRLLACGACGSTKSRREKRIYTYSTRPAIRLDS